MIRGQSRVRYPEDSRFGGEDTRGPAGVATLEGKVVDDER